MLKQKKLQVFMKAKTQPLLIQEYELEAGKHYNIRPNNIACCLCKSSKAKTAGGKHWEYDNQ